MLGHKYKYTSFQASFLVVIGEMKMWVCVQPEVKREEKLGMM
jgi:hypothetical protein